jgi:4-aminobutyrate aminotransferase / (S)-3-amino-2-methylpropionate transaminase / 5-aminovalerate transaminase
MKSQKHTVPNVIINSQIPNPNDIKDFDLLKDLEHASMHNELSPAFWNKAEDYSVYDANGNKWIDFTSSVAVTNSGHANPLVCQAIEEVLKNKLLTTFTFPHKYRLELSQYLHDLLFQSAKEDYKLHFLSSGAEAVECALDMSIEYKNRDKSIIISFLNDFHGNTTQADSLSGGRELTTITRGNKVTYYLKLPFIAKGDEQKSTFLSNLNNTLSKFQLSIEDVITILLEPYQGRGVYAADTKFVDDLVQFCKERNVFLILDETQSGFYRTGKRFCFEYYNLQPDLICLGKGISSSLPLSAIAGKRHIFDKTQNFEVLTTHSANPLSCAAAMANIKFMETDKFLANLKGITPIFEREVGNLQEINSNVNYTECLGMVAGIHISENGKPSSKLAKKLVYECFRKGLLINAPNGSYKSYLRLTPPLTITKGALQEGFDILKQTLKEI